MVKSKSITTEETRLNEDLAARGIRCWETDLAQLIIQLADDSPSHILVPAIHKNRAEIRELFMRTLEEAPADLTDDPRALAEVARRHLRRKFLSAPGGDQRSELRGGARQRHGVASSSPRATAACAPRCPRCS